MGTPSERLAKFEKVVKSLNRDKKYLNDTGDPILMRMNGTPKKVPTISTGSVVFDVALGGGFGKGRIIEVYGAESSGKTTLALTAIGNVQREGGVAVFIDAEHALDPVYAQKLGVNVGELFLAQPVDAETTLDLISDVASSGTADIIVVDSVAALVPRRELEGDAGDVTVGEIARLLSRELRKLISIAARTGTTIIFINQTRDQIGGFSPMGTPKTTPGGKALKFFASQRVEIRKGKPITEKQETIGTELNFTVKKNKIAPPFRKGTTILSYAHGINREAEMIAVGAEFESVITKPNNRTYIDTKTGETMGTSKADAINYLKEHPAVFERLTKTMREALDEKYGSDSPVTNSEEGDEDFLADEEEFKSKRGRASESPVSSDHDDEDDDFFSDK